MLQEKICHQSKVCRQYQHWLERKEDVRGRDKEEQLTFNFGEQDT